MIKLQNINFEYNGGKKVFVDFSAEFADGEISCILGSSGVGKTTLLNLLAGIVEPQSGTISGQKNDSDTVHGISYVFQEPRLIPNLTVFDNLDFVLCGVYTDKIERAQKIIAMLEKAKILDTQNKYPKSLSGGMAQQVSLARAFLYPSPLLLLDEPFVGLDIKTKDSIIKMFLDLYKTSKKTVIYVTHDIEDALTLGGDIYVLADNCLTKTNQKSQAELKKLLL